MENDEWNFDEWQGRSEKQVTTNNKVFGYVIIFGVFILMLLLIHKSLILLGVV